MIEVWAGGFWPVDGTATLIAVTGLLLAIIVTAVIRHTFRR